jgi:hypothetical protein
MDRCFLCNAPLIGLVCPDCGAVHDIDCDGRLILVESDGDEENECSDSWFGVEQNL